MSILEEKRTVSIACDNQTSATFTICRGTEKYIGSECKILTSFTISNIPPLPKSQGEIDVFFKINGSGCLEIRAKMKNADVQGELKTVINLSDYCAALEDIVEEYCHYSSIFFNGKQK